MNSRFLRFGFVGAIGFVCDAGILLAAVTFVHLSPLPARILSFAFAATVTFSLNQRFTFRLGNKFAVGRWIFYLTTTAIGACINIGIYRLWIIYNGATPFDLLAGAAAGSIVAMLVNYFSSTMLVFRAVDRHQRRNPPTSSH